MLTIPEANRPQQAAGAGRRHDQLRASNVSTGFEL
jgi:hypothetical protein